MLGVVEAVGDGLINRRGDGFGGRIANKNRRARRWFRVSLGLLFERRILANLRLRNIVVFSAFAFADCAGFRRARGRKIDSRQMYNVAEVRTAGGRLAIEKGGNPGELLREIKKRLFAE